MVTCEKCGASIADDMNFCTECGHVLGDNPKDSTVNTEQENLETASDSEETIEHIDDTIIDIPNDKSDYTQDSEDLTAVLDEVNIDEDSIDGDSLGEEANEWAKENITDAIIEDEPDTSSKPIISTPPSIKSTTIFTTKGKNTFSDKFIGLFLLAFIVVLSFFSFTFSGGAQNSKDYYTMFIDIAPLFIVALSGLLLARTGNIDFTPIAIMITTYFLLVSGYNDENFYMFALYIICGAIVLGLLSGLMSALSLIPNVFTSVAAISLSFVYITTLLNDSSKVILPGYKAFTTNFVVMGLVIFTFLAMFIMIYLTKLGKPMYLRKGIMVSDRFFFTFIHVISYVIAAAAGFALSINASVEPTMSAAVLTTFDYMIATLFIIGICGASSFFDNKYMPPLIFIFAFIIWFNINFIVSKSFSEDTSIIIDYIIKCFFLVLALVGDRVYTRNQLPEYYNTTCVRKNG